MCVFSMGWNNCEYWKQRNYIIWNYVKIQNIITGILKKLKQIGSVKNIWALKPMNKEQMQV